MTIFSDIFKCFFQFFENWVRKKGIFEKHNLLHFCNVIHNTIAIFLNGYSKFLTRKDKININTIEQLNSLQCNKILYCWTNAECIEFYYDFDRNKLVKKSPRNLMKFRRRNTWKYRKKELHLINIHHFVSSIEQDDLPVSFELCIRYHPANINTKSH